MTPNSTLQITSARWHKRAALRRIDGFPVPHFVAGGQIFVHTFHKPQMLSLRATKSRLGLNLIGLEYAETSGPTELVIVGSLCLQIHGTCQKAGHIKPSLGLREASRWFLTVGCRGQLAFWIIKGIFTTANKLPGPISDVPRSNNPCKSCSLLQKQSNLASYYLTAAFIPKHWQILRWGVSLSKSDETEKETLCPSSLQKFEFPTFLIAWSPCYASSFINRVSDDPPVLTRSRHGASKSKYGVCFYDISWIDSNSSNPKHKK